MRIQPDDTMFDGCCIIEANSGVFEDTAYAVKWNNRPFVGIGMTSIPCKNLRIRCPEAFAVPREGANQYRSGSSSRVMTYSLL